MHKLAYLYVFLSLLYFWINLVFIRKQKKSQNKQNPTTTKKPTPLSSARAAGVQKIWGALPGWVSLCEHLKNGRGTVPRGLSGNLRPALPSIPTDTDTAARKIHYYRLFHPGECAAQPAVWHSLTGKPTCTEISCCLFSLPFRGSSWRQVFLWWKGYGFVVAHWESRDAAKMCTVGCRCPHPACIMHGGNAWTWQH